MTRRCAVNVNFANASSLIKRRWFMRSPKRYSKCGGPKCRHLRHSLPIPITSIWYLFLSHSLHQLQVDQGLSLYSVVVLYGFLTRRRRPMASRICFSVGCLIINGYCVGLSRDVFRILRYHQDFFQQY